MLLLLLCFLESILSKATSLESSFLLINELSKYFKKTFSINIKTNVIKKSCENVFILWNVFVTISMYRML